MTAIDTARLVEMLLDDSIDWYFPDILRAINEAQMTLIRQFYMTQNEIALRPLYRRDWDLANGALLQERDAGGVVVGPAQLLYPRSAIVYSTGGNETKAYTANYLNYYNFKKYKLPAFESWVSATDINRYPKAAYYAIEQTMPAGGPMQNKIIFNSNSPDSRIDLTYIKKPRIFNVDYDNAANDSALEVEDIYQPLICALAAEILNDIDVLEQEKGMTMFQNQRINYNDIVEDIMEK